MRTINRVGRCGTKLVDLLVQVSMLLPVMERQRSKCRKYRVVLQSVRITTFVVSMGSMMIC